MASGQITIEVRTGPVLKSAVGVLELAHDLLDLIPEWHTAERQELAERAARLAETVSSNIRRDCR